MERERLVSLDAFRGLTIAAMILVNNPGEWGRVYWPLDHAPWHGWTPTDLIFPFFLFMVGMALPFSQRTKGSEALRRTLVIAGLGHLHGRLPVLRSRDRADPRRPRADRRLLLRRLVGPPSRPARRPGLARGLPARLLLVPHDARARAGRHGAQPRPGDEPGRLGGPAAPGRPSLEGQQDLGSGGPPLHAARDRDDAPGPPGGKLAAIGSRRESQDSGPPPRRRSASSSSASPGA